MKPSDRPYDFRKVQKQKPSAESYLLKNKPLSIKPVIKEEKNLVFNYIDLSTMPLPTSEAIKEYLKNISLKQ